VGKELQTSGTDDVVASRCIGGLVLLGQQEERLSCKVCFALHYLKNPDQFSAISALQCGCYFRLRVM